MTATRSLSATLQHLNRTMRADEAAQLPDAELVGRFVEQRDEAAFTALVRRYGVLVFGVCRRVLRHEQDAEDAFQATFLVFARDAARVQHTSAIANWLYGVAHNVARKARGNRHRREAKEQIAAKEQRREAQPEAPNDLLAILDAELGAMPDKYRAAIVLCDLQGMTAQEAAAEVGCPPKTLGTRLSRGRAILAQRLTRRGVTLSAVALGTALGQTASAAVPSQLLDSAACAAVGFVTGAAPVGAGVAALTHGVSNVLTFSSLKVAVLAVGLLVTGAVTSVPLVHHHLRAHPADQTTQTSPNADGVPFTRQTETPPALPKNHLEGLHNFLMSLLPERHTEPTAAPIEDKKQEAPPKALTGTWVKKDGEMKLEFADKKTLKMSPHGKDDVILVLCEYTVGKDHLVEVKVTGFEGADGAKKKLGMLIPEGTKFSFVWKTDKATATLDDLKGDEIAIFKSHLEGTFEEKK